ncbi:uncharacterized protein A4U43_C01F10670 [Asparagus officinalis]|uniref:Uncharacterized protein n=1 Tax=Asparagus officinalis TaxID=4686 RepID=A0A5P1FSZ8_ASPOF|nr:uncharacterized protein A4U43_C01F10670 [Asparagus officinalis]
MIKGQPPPGQQEGPRLRVEAQGATRPGPATGHGPPRAEREESADEFVVRAEPFESSESGQDEPDTKRRKLKSLGSSVVRSASVLARTLMACEEKRETRHRELLELEERRVKLEEERTEVNRQAVTGLISAVNGLSNAIHALVSDHRRGQM